MTCLRTHPGEVLLEEFMRPLGLNDTAVAEASGIEIEVVAGLIREKQPLSVDSEIAERLSAAFNTSPAFWRNLQLNHDLSKVPKPRIGPGRRP